MFILSGGGFCDLLTDVYDTIIGVSGSSRALCLRLSSLLARHLFLRVLEGLGGSDGDDKEGRLSCLGSDGSGLYSQPCEFLILLLADAHHT
jgi:hypothetical protein